MENEKKPRESTILKPFKRPPRAHVSKEEMLRNMRSIKERRQQYLADLRAELCAELRGEDSR
jgi:hypothetical protein